jgi:ACS family sodium-dependent inorganic phosphate cotransporter
MTEIRNVTLENGTMITQQHFDWNSKQKGYILSAFYYGYLCTQVVGGVIAAKIGGNIVSIGK